MLRLFSNIRKTLILRRQGSEGQVNEGKTSRYVRYAVGEVLLIMVGIILALQFQNWNEGRLLEQERRELIENLKVDFRTNLERLETTIGDAEKMNASLQSFLHVAAVDNSHLTVEELRQLASDGIGPIMFRPALGTYHSAISDGSIGLIKSPQLNELIINFEQHYSYYLINQNMDRESVLTGEAMSLRRELGSLAVLWNRNSYAAPETYVLSDSEYRKLIARTEVYAFFELTYNLQDNQKRRLWDAKVTAQQILTALEALD